jgi:Transposase DDE domain
VPAQDRVRGDQQPQPLAARFRYHADQGHEQGPVRPGQLRAARLLALQDGELAAQEQDLSGLPGLLPPGQPQPEGRWSRGAPPNDRNPPPGGTGREALGRSRGAPSTKIHLAADRRCRPVTRILTPGQHGDCPQSIPLMDQVRIPRRGTGRPRTRPGRAMADKAYSAAANRAYLRRRGIQAVIP